MFKTYLAVMAGGAVGVGLRMWITDSCTHWFGQNFPWGTMAVNVLGCLVIGVFTGLTGPNGNFIVSHLTRQIVMIGVLGGFTTYSSFSLQTIHLLAAGNVLSGMGNIAVTLVLCLLGTWAGLALTGFLPLK